MHSSSRTTRSRSQYNRDNVGSRSSKTNVAAVREGKQNSSSPAAHGGGPGRTRTSNQTVMGGGTRIAGIDFPGDLTRSTVFVASRYDRFWCEAGAVNHRPPDHSPSQVIDFIEPCKKCGRKSQ